MQYTIPFPNFIGKSIQIHEKMHKLLSPAGLESFKASSGLLKVSVQGVKSLWGDSRFIPVMGTRRINDCLCVLGAHCWKKPAITKVI